MQKYTGFAYNESIFHSAFPKQLFSFDVFLNFFSSESLILRMKLSADII